MVVVRPDDLVRVDVEIEFNFLIYNKLEIDLRHINQGKSLTRHTGFTTFDIMDVVSDFLDGEICEVDEQKDYGKYSCNYFSLIKKFNSNYYKLVFCTCTDKPDTLGIITMYRVKGMTK